MRGRALAELSFPCLPSVASATSAFLGGLENLMSPLGSWHTFWVLLPPQAGQTQLNSQFPSIQPHQKHWHQALCISWPLLSSSPAWHFLEWLLCIPREKLLPSWEDGVAPEKKEEGREKKHQCQVQGSCTL